jgi:hypothetical protein
MEVRVKEAYPGQWILQSKESPAASWVGIEVVYVNWNKHTTGEQEVKSVNYFPYPASQLQHCAYSSADAANAAARDYRAYREVLSKLKD